MHCAKTAKVGSNSTTTQLCPLKSSQILTFSSSVTCILTPFALPTAPFALSAAALSEGRIRGAALDVFETEPLPADSQLWGMDNVLMSPHCADKTKEFQFESIEFFVANVKRHLVDEPLQNICDKRAGY